MFTGRGNDLLCGYVHGDFSTFASGELRAAVAPAPTVTGPSATTPGSTTPEPRRSPPPPWITRKGHALTCHPGIWSNAPTSLSYRWSVQGRSKTVASRRRLTVHHSLKGRTVVGRVTATNAAGTKTASSRSVTAR